MEVQGAYTREKLCLGIANKEFFTAKTPSSPRKIKNIFKYLHESEPVTKYLAWPWRTWRLGGE